MIAYELLNEPNPEVLEEREQWSRTALEEFYKKSAGTAADLNELYRRVVEEVRKVDLDAPIVLDAGLWAGPAALFNLRPMKEDPYVLYSFHWYAPEKYTIWQRNRGQLVYPGCVTTERGAKGGEERMVWDAEAHARHMADPVRRWQREHGVPASRILCGEFSADRRAAGADLWNRDVIALLDANLWHWTYYDFRERDWNAKDFELGSSLEGRERSLHPMMKTFVEPMRANQP